MKVVFRVDASIKIGTGHVMRCLTLAAVLRDQGIDVLFLCRPHSGHLIQLIEQKGYEVARLAQPNSYSDETLFHSDWLGVTQQQDAEQCAQFLHNKPVDWLIVDHYALDKNWQTQLKPYCEKLMVIDDLGDREHLCDWLLDQNYGATTAKYQHLVPDHCQILAGADYSLLRSEFAEWRDYSLNRRTDKNTVENILITMGGVDPDNYTGKILAQMSNVPLSGQEKIIVVMGANAPHLQTVQYQAAAMPFDIEIKTNVANMAEIMANADIAIGAAGSTTWERCCLGLPTIQLVIAENQRQIAEALSSINVVQILDEVSFLPKVVRDALNQLKDLTENSSRLVDGQGASRVTNMLSQSYQNQEGHVFFPYTALTPKQSLFVLAMRNHESIRKWMHQQKMITESEHLAFVGSLKSRIDRRFFMVQRAEKIIGTLNFTDIDNEQRRAEFGIFANPFLAEKGQGTALMILALDYALKILKLNELDLVVYDDNYAAICLYKKFGFIETYQSQQESKTLIHMTKQLTESIPYEN
ncbi:UDP-2,4-diacetamido-2,4,6-trideoxy-beta-L-altropyranose hydrolase [Thiomicrorhabdus indica]|uniref:UDP-2,4-diacetamido-2,4, 6-trideoxy-beta-L-altropyranose hydrolase n=1 Tax=Thiomicrorhabdus indica TaxID=2267253 RepID=UPI00102D7674|nr:UDP-2,4-diacetamido-2,4,6-trideoxy-beta-L-altropyranose hydrolase [Thiomicrorhabdus indica]